MNNRYLFFVIAAIIFSTVTAFAETTIKVEVNKTKLSTDEALTYKIVISSDEKNIPAPELPKFTGFRGISNARSSTTSFANKGIKRILVYAYVLVPYSIGKLKIEPSKLKIGNKVYESSAFEIEVLQGKNKPVMPPKIKSAPHKNIPLGSSEPQYTL
jgi:hypothetical protein